MGALAPAIAIGAVVAGSATQAVGSIMAGREQARTAAFEQQQLQIQEQQARTASMESEARRREELTSSLETIQALRAGRNTGAYSPTGQAILSSSIEDTERDISIEKANYATKADLSRRAAEMAGHKAKTSLLAGYLGAAGAAAQGVTSGYKIYRGYA
jgi:hypothetical protein